MGNFTKKELISRLSGLTGLTAIDCTNVVENTFKAIAEAMREGRNSEFRGFGRFKVREKKGGKRRNPKTGASLEKDAYTKVFFYSSPYLRDFVNKKVEDFKIGTL